MPRSTALTIIAAFLLTGSPLMASPLIDGTANIDFESTDSLDARIDPMDDVVARPAPRRRTTHRRTTTTYRRPTTTYHRTYYPRRVSHSHVVVVREHERRPVSRPAVVEHTPRAPLFSAGLRFAALTLGNTDLRYETFDGDSLVGVGVYLRAKVDKHFGVEVSSDVLGTDNADFEQFTVPVMVGLTAHLFPENVLDIYGIAGAGLHFTTINYATGVCNRCLERYMQLAGQLGGGIELNLGALELLLDLRYVMTQARPEREENIRTALGLADQNDPDALTHGLQFTLGLGGNF